MGITSVLLLCLLAGCQGRQAAPVEIDPEAARRISTSSGAGPGSRRLEMVSNTGGAHHRTIVTKGYWLQTFSTALYVLSQRTGSIEARLDFGPVGIVGAAVDMAVIDDRLLVVLDRHAVAEVDLSTLPKPTIARTVEHGVLGIRPRRVSAVGSDFVVAGEGGAVRWSTMTRAQLDGVTATAGSAVATPEGAVICCGRRIHSLEGKGFVGAASELLALPPSAPAPLAFALQGAEAFTVGFMGADLRELASVVVPGTMRRLRWFDDRLWVVTDLEILSARYDGTAFVDRHRFPVKGARDVDRLDGNHLAVAGSFGRAIYRERSEGLEKPGDTFIGARREASRLMKAITDNRRILAGSDEGNWVYLIGADAQITTRSLEIFQQPTIRAAGTWGSAVIADDGRSVQATIGGTDRTYVPEGSPILYCLASADDAIWLGHEFGIDVFGLDAQGSVAKLGSLLIDGPVRYIFPKWDDGIAYVAELGGFGVARLRPAETPPASADRGRSPRD
ncbi:MAG TPA: hypothetical protein PKC43_04800 [Phycisphaerales bacterium]|nr:hypothetical protein [Phycisphaerales bacterium]HMP36747.1 hypothetical protein [Phycisphaerales bacterium]